MCALTISGKAFLWHQIRCIVAVLFRVGSGKESPDVVRQLLDIETNPRRPQYTMASEIPLNLFNVHFDDDIAWNYDPTALDLLIRQLQMLWTEHSVKASMLRTTLSELESIESSKRTLKKIDDLLPVFQLESLVSGNNKTREYIPLMDMQSCPALEEKLGSSAAKRRKNLTPTSSNKLNE